MRDSIPAFRMAIMSSLNSVAFVCFLTSAVLGVLNLVGLTAVPLAIIWSLVGAGFLLFLVAVILFASVSRSLFKRVHEDNSW